METYDEIYNAFIAALRFFAEKEGYGGQSFLAAEAGISNGFLSQVMRGSYSKKAGIKTQIALAKACGYEYKDFISFGRELLSDNGKETRNIELVQPDEKKESPPEIDSITLEHLEIVKKFSNKEQAKKINEYLLAIDKQYSDSLKEVEWILQGMAAGLKFRFEVVNNSQLSNQTGDTGGKLKNGTEH